MRALPVFFIFKETHGNKLLKKLILLSFLFNAFLNCFYHINYQTKQKSGLIVIKKYYEFYFIKIIKNNKNYLKNNTIC